VEKRAEDARTKGREELAEVQRQISGLEESNRLLVQRIAAGKTAVEMKDTEEEKARMKVIDEREDVEDRKVEMEWVDSQTALSARHDVVKAEFDDVPTPEHPPTTPFCTHSHLLVEMDIDCRRIESTVRPWRCLCKLGKNIPPHQRPNTVPKNRARDGVDKRA
jgi:hypothetical protein